MRNGFLGSITTLVAGAGLAWAQSVPPSPNSPPAQTAPAWPVAGAPLMASFPSSPAAAPAAAPAAPTASPSIFRRIGNYLTTSPFEDEPPPPEPYMPHVGGRIMTTPPVRPPEPPEPPPPPKAKPAPKPVVEKPPEPPSPPGVLRRVGTFLMTPVEDLEPQQTPPPAPPLPEVGTVMRGSPVVPPPVQQTPPPRTKPIETVSAPAEPEKHWFKQEPTTPAPPIPTVGLPMLSTLGLPPYPGAYNIDGPFFPKLKQHGVECYESRFWVNAEYLLWWARNAQVTAPLLTTSTLTTPVIVNGSLANGVLGQPQTSVVFGNSSIDYGLFSGGRLSMGFAHESELIGVEANAFFLPSKSFHFMTASNANGNPVLVRPFINAQTNQETGLVVSFPGAFNGSFEVASSSQLWGSDINAVVVLLGNCYLSLEAIGGFRYCDLNESFQVDNGTTFVLPGGLTFLNGVPFLTPNSDSLQDRFVAHNQFYGGQIGLQGEFRYQRFFMDVIAKVALGSTHQVIDVSGSTTLNQPGIGSQTATGGLLAITTNIGNRNHDVFSVLPEATVNIGYQICDNLRAYIGYNYLYWSDVVRPADQIDRRINETQLPTSQTFGRLVGPALPTVSFRQTPYWAQGLTFGFALRF